MVQKEQTATQVFITQLEAGASPPRNALKAISRDQKIQRFDTDKIKLEEYVQGMSTHTDV